MLYCTICVDGVYFCLSLCYLSLCVSVFISYLFGKEKSWVGESVTTRKFERILNVEFWTKIQNFFRKGLFIKTIRNSIVILVRDDTQKFSSKNKKEISSRIHTLLSVKGCNVKIARLRNSNIFTWKFSINHSEYDARFRFSKLDRFDLRRMCRSFVCVPLSCKVKFCHGPRTVYIFTPIPSYRRVDRHRIFVRWIRTSFYAVLVAWT